MESARIQEQINPNNYNQNYGHNQNMNPQNGNINYSEFQQNIYQGNPGNQGNNDQYGAGQKRDTMTNNSNYQYDRRHYPQNLIGAKSEWQGLEKHHSEVDFELKQAEIDIAKLRQKDLLTELEKQKLMQYEMRKDELLKKQSETQVYQVRQAEYQNSLQKMQEDKQYMKVNLANEYENQMKSALEQQMKEEQNLKARKLLQSEQRKRRLLRQHQKSEFQQNISLFQQRRRKEKLDKDQQRNQYNQLIKYNNIKDQIKEENYKNFFKSVVKNQDHIQKHHVDHVLGPLLDRERALEAAFTSKANTVEARAIEIELQQLRAKKDELMRSKDTNKMLIGQHEQRKEFQRLEKQTQAQRRLEEQLKYREMEQHQRKLKQDQKLQYREFLDKQELKLNNQRMTRNEQGLNQLDLQAFQTYDPGLYTMLPGWSPQIGQLPPKENRELMQHRVMNELKKKHEVDPNFKLTSSEIKLLDNGSAPNIKETLFANVAQNSLTPSLSMGKMKPYQKIGEPDRRYQDDVNRGGQIGSFDSQQSGLHTRSGSQQFLFSVPNHNPITNALSMNYYNNPYLRQEILRGSNQSKSTAYNNNANIGQNDQVNHTMRGAGAVPHNIPNSINQTIM